MANRYEGDPHGGRSDRDNNDEFRNRGRSEWDDDHGNGSGHGRGYGRPRLDADNDQGRLGAEDLRAGRFADYDRDWSDLSGRPLRFDDRRGRRDDHDLAEPPARWPGQRPSRAWGAHEGPFGGFAGGSRGYESNREYRSEHPYESEYATAEENMAAARRYRQGMDGGQRPQTGFARSPNDEGPYGTYSTNWAETGRMAGGPMSHHDEDYYHWRSQQIGKLDRDYEDWRAERRQKFKDEFEKWRASRPQNPADEHLANANPRDPNPSANTDTTGSSQPGSSRSK